MARSSKPIVTAPLLAFSFSLAMLGGAYAFQFIGGMTPCQMCYWQRWVHWAVAGIALMAIVVARNPKLRAPLFALVALALAASVAVAGFHAGVEYGWWEGPKSCTSVITDMNEIGSAPSIFDDLAEPTTPVDCSKPAWVMAGISMAGWNALASLGALLAFLSFWKRS